MKVFILENEKDLAKSMKEFLTAKGYEVTHMLDAENAFDSIYANRYDLLLLDANDSAFELLLALKDTEINLPAIFMSSLKSIDNLTKAYVAGACDYIRKPFALTELQLRVEQAIKTHCFSSTKSIIDLSFDYKYNITKMQLSLDEELVLLSKTETKVLELLVKNRNSVVTYEMFWDEVWGDWIDPANIRVQVGSLRKKLLNPFIQNVQGRGYRIAV